MSLKVAKTINIRTNARPIRKPDFLSLFRERPAADRLDQIEQKVAAIEKRDREQVQKPDRDRQNRREIEDRAKTQGCDLPRDLGDPDRARRAGRRIPGRRSCRPR